MKKLFLIIFLGFLSINGKAQGWVGSKGYTTHFYRRMLKSIDGVLYGVSIPGYNYYTVLIKVPTKRYDSFTVPSEVEGISFGAFYGCNIGTLYLPQKFEEIGGDAFVGANIENFVVVSEPADAVQQTQEKNEDGKEVARYNLNGARLPKPQKGINIVQTTSGTYKEIVK